MRKPPEISSERKTMYYLGGAIQIAGVLLFVSNFFIVAQSMSQPFGMMYRNPVSGMLFRALGGMALMVVGHVIRNVGARGAAGSGLVLDPQRAREDLKPWAQTAGGLVKDALEEVRPEAAEPAEPVVKVRCQQCKTLNDEDAKFCKGCGAAM